MQVENIVALMATKDTLMKFDDPYSSPESFRPGANAASHLEGRTWPRKPHRATNKTIHWAGALSTIALIEESKRGITGGQFEQIQEEANFSNEEWSRYLQITPRTIQRYRKEQTIDPVTSERALLVAQVVERGLEVFGLEERFKLWFYAPSIALGGRAPSDLLDTATGMQIVQSELTRIEHGVY